MTCSMFTNGHICLTEKISDKFCFEHINCKVIESDICNICLDDFDDRLDKKLYNKLDELKYKEIFIECGHSFHLECLNQWFLKKNTCPCCRKILNTQSISEIEINVNELNTIPIDNEFIHWLIDCVNTYVNNLTGVSIFNFYLVLTMDHQYNYFMNVYINSLNNIPIDLFELELRLNQIADDIREDNNQTIDESERMDINELEFVSFGYVD
jgi:hypothetical protein